MGGENTKVKQLSYDPKNWQEVQKSTFYEVMKNSNGQQAQRYHFNIKSQRDHTEEIDIYSKRKDPANWVQVIGANIEKGGFGFCGSQEYACVLTERIPVLLNSIKKLNKQESSIVLYNALKGFNDIRQIVTPRQITDKMIGFNSQGRTKIWINENFGMNYSSHHIDTKVQQRQIINNLITAIHLKVDLSTDLLEGIKNSDSFTAALNFFRTTSGVAEGILQGNIINISQYLNQTPNQIIKIYPVVDILSNGVTQTITNTNPSQLGYTPYNSYPLQPIQSYGSQYRNTNVQWTHNPINTNNPINTSGMYRNISNNYMGQERISEQYA